MADVVDPRVTASRARIAEAASELFSTGGYITTTIADIAREANVAVQTVYNAVGSKAAVLSLVLDAAAAGAQPPGSVPTFMRARVDAAVDAAAVVDVLADWFAELHPRTADVFAMIDQAAAVDREIADLKARRERARLENYQRAAGSIIARGGGGGATTAELAATIWSLGHPATYAILVHDQAWTVERYRKWVAARLHAALEA